MKSIPESVKKLTRMNLPERGPDGRRISPWDGLDSGGEHHDRATERDIAALKKGTRGRVRKATPNRGVSAVD